LKQKAKNASLTSAMKKCVPYPITNANYQRNLSFRFPFSNSCTTSHACGCNAWPKKNQTCFI